MRISPASRPWSVDVLAHRGQVEHPERAWSSIPTTERSRGTRGRVGGRRTSRRRPSRRRPPPPRWAGAWPVSRGRIVPGRARGGPVGLDDPLRRAGQPSPREGRFEGRAPVQGSLEVGARRRHRPDIRDLAVAEVDDVLGGQGHGGAVVDAHDGHVPRRLPTVTTGSRSRSMRVRSSASMGMLSTMTPSTRFQSMLWVRRMRRSKESPSRSKRSTWCPWSRSAFSMPLTRVAKNQRVRNGATTPTTPVRPDARLAAVGEAT